ncbi:hypothetical protein [Paenibacillus phytohabitans]|uniref:hypothetical protein n=1 Tax=Paenibacillus phytohabitans TaxID=2654978 RepID=UPI00300BD1CB
MGKVTLRCFDYHPGVSCDDDCVEFMDHLRVAIGLTDKGLIISNVWIEETYGIEVDVDTANSFLPYHKGGFLRKN